MISVDSQLDMVKMNEFLELCKPETRKKMFAIILTELARAGRNEVIKQMPSRFTIRRPGGKWNITTGIRMTAAQKSQANPTSLVYTKDWYMKEQEAGGNRLAASTLHFPLVVKGGMRMVSMHVLPVPLRPPQGSMPSSSRVTPKALMPRSLLADSKAFVIQNKNGNLILVTYKKAGEWKNIRGTDMQRREAARLKLWYVLINSEKIPPRLKMADTVRSIVASELEQVARAVLAKQSKNLMRG